MYRSKSSLVELINNVLIEAFAIAPERLQDQTIDFEQLGLDSLDMAEIVYEVEDRFSIVVKDVGRLNRMSLAEAYAFFHDHPGMKEGRHAAPDLSRKLGVAAN